MVVQHLCISRRGFVFLWWALLSFQGINVAFLLMLTIAYAYFQDPEGVLSQLSSTFLFANSQQFLQTNYAFISAGYGLLVLPFAHNSLCMLWFTIRNRDFAFGPGHTERRSSYRVDVHNKNFPRKANILKDNAWAFLSSIRIGGSNFAAFMLGLEFVEVVLQSVQGFLLSKYISNLRLNLLYGCMIFVNCWSTPLIQYFWMNKRHDIMLNQFSRVLTDTFLDFLWGTIFQAALLLPYYEFIRYQQWPQAVPENFDRELRQSLVVCPSNFVFSASPFVASGMVIYELRAVLNNAQIQPRDLACVQPHAQPHVKRISTADLEKSTAGRRSLNPTVLRQATKARWQALRLTTHFTTVYHSTIMLWGLVILFASVAATGVFWPQAVADAEIVCRSRLYPWFTNTLTCVGREINCSRLNISGQRTEISSTLQVVSPYLLANLRFVDCPAMEVPATIHVFHELASLGLSNVTLLDWGADANLTQQYFPQLQTLVIHDTIINCTPHGLTDQPLPSSFEWIYFKDVNAQALLEAAYDSWAMTVYFYCIGCGLLEIPRLLENMPHLQEIALANNHIEHVAIKNVAKNSGMIIRLQANPLNKSVEELWAALPQMLLLDVQQSQVVPPAHVDIGSLTTDLTVRGFDSPLCAPVETLRLLPLTILTCEEQAQGW